MKASTRNDIMGMVVYFLAALAFGGAVAMVLLCVHEDNDRCHYYGGKWNKGDIVRGCLAIGLGMAARWALLKVEW